MQIEYRPLDEIKPYPGNPRINADAVAAVAASIREFGFRNPILLDADGVIVAGHTRLAAARSLGMPEVPVVFITDLSPEQIRALRLADNQTASLSTWHEELLFRELSELHNAEVDLSPLGFSDVELARILAPAGTEGLTDPDEVPPSPEHPVSEPGAVYALGRHRLLCLDGQPFGNEAAQRLLGDDRVDMVLSDLSDSAAGIEELTATLMAMNGFLVPGGAFYLWHGDLDAQRIRTACQNAGWEIRQGLVWENGAPTPDATGEYALCHVNCVYGWKEGAPHRWFSDRCQTTALAPEGVTGLAGPGRDKPVGLLAYLIGNSCPPGGVLLDPFGGTGAVVIAAERTGRRAFIAAATPAKCDVIRQRWAAFVYGASVDFRNATHKEGGSHAN